MPQLYIGEDEDMFEGEDEIFGEDEIIGDDFYLGDDDDDDDELEDIFGDDDDDDYEMGRRPRRRRRRRRMSKKQMMRAAALARMAGGAGTRKKVRRNAFEQPLPIPPTVFAANQQQDIELRPQRLFRTERLVISSLIAPFFSVLDVKIGQETQFVASGALPATIFSEVAVGVRLKGDTANLGNTIVVSLLNNDAVQQTFSGAIIGTVIL